MTNIWSFLLQTITVTTVAVMLLAVKYLLNDKLSPRWQYGVWAVLAVRAVLPATARRYVLLPFSLGLEVLKARVERSLRFPVGAERIPYDTGIPSAYTELYEPIGGDHVLPVLMGKPVTTTDWLFVFYVIGAAAVALWYLVSYVRLRLLLRSGGPVSGTIREKLDRVCKAHDLKACTAVAIPGLSSPFVCGVFRPVLAVPAGEDVDEKVLLHELLHLKYHDALQSIFWCALRCLHWCNPLMHWVIDRIGNDMESLCDQRVLERLEGEERREYGVILLRMANDRYARAPGTTSVSNGGSNIARRIEAIVRFKKYPKGMGLVSVCIVFVLMVPCITGTATAADASAYTPGSISGLPRAMALARIERCDTVAGALDTYAKGLMNENGIYIAMTAPLSEHEELEERMRQSSAEGWYACRLPAGEKLEYMDTEESFFEWFSYGIYELQDNGDGTYSAWLGFAVEGLADENGDLVQELTDSGEVIDAAYRRVYVPVEVYYSDGWCVRETGERVYEFTKMTELLTTQVGRTVSGRTYHAEGKYGTLTIAAEMRYEVDTDSDGSFLYGNAGLNGLPVPDGAFAGVNVTSSYFYELRDTTVSPVAMEACILPTEESEMSYSDGFYRMGGSGGASSDGGVWIRGMNEDLTFTMTNTVDSLQVGGTIEGIYGYGVRIHTHDGVLEEFKVTKEDMA